ncbi:MAG: hypothetical protein FJX89_04510 [Bacteroidetes bacterium]|nr:hypothetical protein [Bacteroidota bacterium]
MPMVYVIHGGSATPARMIRLAGFRTISDREKVLLVCSAGIEKNWNNGRPTTPNQMGIIDVSFFRRICEFMIANHPARSLFSTSMAPQTRWFRSPAVS